MILKHLFSRIRTLFLTLIGVFRRALCCFSRRRRNSESEPLESINIVGNSGPSPSKNKHVPERDWNSWDDGPKTVEEHIEAYRNKLVQPPPEPEQELNMDFFEDMTPKITRQKKILIKTENDLPTDFSRLEAKSDIPVAADLEDWEENEITGWDEISDTNTKQLIREKRKELRVQQRQTKPVMGASHGTINPVVIAERIGTKHS